MSIHLERVRKAIPPVLGGITLAGVVLLFVRDAAPGLFPARSHDFLAAFSLAMIAVAYLAFQWARRCAPMDMDKAVLLAAAFLFWAANQFWPNSPQAGMYNDIAIGLFILDVLLVIVGWPPAVNDAFAPGTTARSAHGYETCCGCSDGCGWTGESGSGGIEHPAS